MLIPNAKFLVLPLVALAVIASLPSTATTTPQGQAFVATTPAKASTDCEQARQAAPRCVLAAALSKNTVVR
jgi:hypothetical protein